MSAFLALPELQDNEREHHPAYSAKKQLPQSDGPA